MTERGSGQVGFTLIEVIAALVVFSLGVLVAATLSGRLSDQMTAATQRSEGTALARETLDSLATVPFDELATGTEESDVEVAGRTYTRRWTVQPLDGSFRTLEIILDVAPPGTDTLRAYVVEPW